MHKVDWALTRPDLGAPAKLLLVTLAWATDHAGVTFIAQKTLGMRVDKDERWVREYLPQLAAAGLVTRYRRRRPNGSVTTDLIILNFPRRAPVDLTVYSGVLGEKDPADADPSGTTTGENPPVVQAAENRRGYRRESAGPPIPLPKPLEDTTPQPPQAGESKIAPSRPVGNRKTDADAYHDEMRSWANEHFPGANWRAVGAAVVAVPASWGDRTPETVRAYAAAMDKRQDSTVWSSMLAPEAAREEPAA